MADKTVKKSFSTVIDNAVVSFKPGDKVSDEIAKECNLASKGLIEKGKNAKT